jgi:glyceraldehyde 3-phosphate dehydrogenase
VEEVCEVFEEASVEGPLQGRLEFSDEPLVSSDIIGSEASCVFDAPMTMASGTVVKVLGWYDNEWGYANRLAELTAMVADVPAA